MLAAIVQQYSTGRTAHALLKLQPAAQSGAFPFPHAIFIITTDKERAKGYCEIQSPHQ